MKRNLLKEIAMLLFLAGTCWSLNAQPKKDSVPPLFRFFQHNFDTTIISGISSNWFSTELPRYEIVATQDGKTYFFAYKNPYPNTRWPKSLSSILSRESLAYISCVPDTNQYLFPVRLSHEKTTIQIMKCIDSLSMWTIRDDQIDGEGCPECRSGISDAGYFNFYLITSSKIKRLRFYAPDYYEKRCKPRDGRQRIRQVINIFNEVFLQ